MCLPQKNKNGSNMSLNMSLKQDGHLSGARNYMILKVGTAGFEPTASCTPSKRAELWDKNGTKLSLFLGLTLDHKLVAEAVNG